MTGLGPDCDFGALQMFRWLIMFALIRIAYLCLLAVCCSGAFANVHSVRASDPARSSDSSLDLAPSMSPLDILPHRALPPAEPFNLSVNESSDWRSQPSGASFSPAFLLTRRRSRPAAQTNVLARRLNFAFCQLLNLLENTRGAPGWAGSIVRST